MTTDKPCFPLTHTHTHNNSDPLIHYLTKHLYTHIYTLVYVLISSPSLFTPAYILFLCTSLLFIYSLVVQELVHASQKSTNVELFLLPVFSKCVIFLY